MIYRIFYFSLFLFPSVGKLLRTRNLETRLQWTTQENRILLNGEPVAIKGITWNGLETDTISFFGLWKHSLEFYMDQLRLQNFNAISVPFSAEWSYYHRFATPFHSVISNDFECINKTSLQILDLFFEKSLRKNLLVVLQLNRLHKDFLTKGWMSPPEYNITVFYDAWFNILDRYKEQKNLLGIDIFNEPFGITRMEPWSNFCVEFLDVLNTRYPQNSWLFFIQGIHYGEYYQNNTFHFQGKSYENRIIYTPHVYDSQFPNTFTKKTSVDTLYEEWDLNFGFLSPLVITKSWSRSTIWLNFLSNYLNQKQLNNIFLWELSNNPTNGILFDDWETFDNSKLSIINSIQPNQTHFYMN